MDIKLFYNNQQSIKLSYDIAESFRKQNFYIATSKLKKLLGNQIGRASCRERVSSPV